MCKKNEYYDIDTTECLPCSECPKGDKILLECSYFGDTLCEKDVLAGFQIAPYPTPGTPSPVTRGAGTVAVEVLPEDWTTSPTVLMVVTAVCFTTLMVTIVIALYCFRRKVWSPKQEKEILYLSRRKFLFILHIGLKNISYHVDFNGFVMIDIDRKMTRWAFNHCVEEFFTRALH